MYNCFITELTSGVANNLTYNKLALISVVVGLNVGNGNMWDSIWACPHVTLTVDINSNFNVILNR